MISSQPATSSANLCRILWELPFFSKMGNRGNMCLIFTLKRCIRREDESYNLPDHTGTFLPAWLTSGGVARFREKCMGWSSRDKLGKEGPPHLYTPADAKIKPHPLYLCTCSVLINMAAPTAISSLTSRFWKICNKKKVIRITQIYFVTQLTNF